MKENRKYKSALVWFLSTIPICVLPFLLTYVFQSYTNGKLLDIKKYTNDIILMICSVACGLIVLAFDSSKYITDKMKIGSRIYSVFVAVVSGSFYFYMAGENVKDYISLIIGLFLIVSCIVVGCILGNAHDKNKKIYEKDRAKLCKDFFDEAIPSKYRDAFDGIGGTVFCEMREVDPIKRLRAEKKKK